MRCEVGGRKLKDQAAGKRSVLEIGGPRSI